MSVKYTRDDSFALIDKLNSLTHKSISEKKNILKIPRQGAVEASGANE